MTSSEKSLWIISIQNLQILEYNSPLRQEEIYWQLPIVLLDPAEELWSFLFLLQSSINLQSWRQCSLQNTFRNTLVVTTGKVSIRCHSSFAIYSEVSNKSDAFEQKIDVGRNFSTSMAIVDVLAVETNRLILTLHHKLADKINQ